jgi:ubiquinone biosynthesis protein
MMSTVTLEVVGGRLFRIGVATAGLLWVAAVERFRGTPAEASLLPQRLRIAVEQLGPTFVKLGQALSLRRDLLPDPWLAELGQLQDRVAPFPGVEARRTVEAALGRPIEQVFAAFETEPMAAGSIAQVHRARLTDGRAVIVKVRRPGIRVQIDRDMRALVGVGRLALIVAPRLHRFQPLRLIQEIWTNLRKEADFRQEARSIRRFSEAFREWPTLYIPDVVDDLYAETVLVQEMSGGLGIGDPSVDGPRLAQVLVEVYLHQFLVLGLFHGDPHPGNLFVRPDGRLCFHDFGLVGYLDGRTRRALALYLQAFVHQDAAWMLDAAVDLGLLGGALDRTAFIRGIEEILADYASLPLKDWSLAEAMLRVARLGSGKNFVIPHNLVVLMRALVLVESALRTLDPDFKVLDTLLTRGREVMEGGFRQGAAATAFARLKTEAVLTAQDLPGLAAAWLHRARREGGGPLLVMRHEGLESLETHLDRTGNRLALAIVTLGLYVAASLLMLHSAGPRVFGDLPLLALLGYALALWLSFRLVRAIVRSGRL